MCSLCMRVILATYKASSKSYVSLSIKKLSICKRSQRVRKNFRFNGKAGQALCVCPVSVFFLQFLSAVGEADRSQASRTSNAVRKQGTLVEGSLRSAEASGKPFPP